MSVPATVLVGEGEGDGGAVVALGFTPTTFAVVTRSVLFGLRVVLTVVVIAVLVVGLVGVVIFVTVGLVGGTVVATAVVGG